MPILIQTSNLSKIYAKGKRQADIETPALRDITLQIQEGEFTAIMGPSGSGKSTLMHILGFLDTPTSGEYLFEGKKTSNLTEDLVADIRRDKIGFVFQAFNLLPRTSALDNVILPLIYSNAKELIMKKKAEEMLDRVGLSDRRFHKPNELSGGQQQRVAIARALISDPSVIFADEPTGNLDSKSSLEIMEIFQKLNKEGRTIILVTHEEEIARYSKRIITLRDGSIVDDNRKDHTLFSADKINAGTTQP